MGSQQHALRLQAQSRTSETGTAPTDRSRARMFRHLFLIASIMLVGAVAWRAWPEVRAAVAVLETVSPALIAVSALLEILAVGALAQVYRASLGAVGSSVSYAQGLQVSMGAFTLSRVLPGGGAAGAVWGARRLQRFGVRGAAASTSVILAGVLGMTTLGVIVAAGTVMALIRGHVTAGSVLAAGAVTLVFAATGAGAVALVRSPSARAAVLARVERVWPRLGGRLADSASALDEVADSLRDARSLLPVIGWSAANWILEIAALWMVFAGLGPHMEFGVLIVGYGVANLVTALPHTPGGLGLVEAGMTGTYVALGTETSVALAAVLAYRLISFWLPVLFGVPQYLRAPVPGGGTRA